MTQAPSSRTRARRLHHKAAYDRATIDAILDAMPVAHIGHLVDGFPVVTPTLQWREGDRIYWHGSSASRMIRAATNAPVCVTVTLTDGMVLARSALEHSVNYRCVMAFGTAEAVTDPALKARHLETMVEQLFPGRWPELRPMTAQEVNDFIAQMRRETKSKAARIRMAEMAISIGNISPEGKDLWRAYLAQERP